MIGNFLYKRGRGRSINPGSSLEVGGEGGGVGGIHILASSSIKASRTYDIGKKTSDSVSDKGWKMSAQKGYF